MVGVNFFQIPKVERYVCRKTSGVIYLRCPSIHSIRNQHKILYVHNTVPVYICAGCGFRLP